MRTTGKQCGLAATGDYQPSLRSPWLAASVLALHLLQISLVYVNTLMIQQVRNEPSWRSRMKLEDFRALTPLIYAHVNPYGIFELDMNTRLPIDEVAA